MPKIFNEQDQKRLRESLLKAGFDMICENGYKATTVDEITKKVKIAKGSFYLFFASKEEFVAELLMWQYGRFDAYIVHEMKKFALSEKERIHNILTDIAQNKNHHFFFLRPAEQAEIRNALNDETWNAFKNDERKFFRRMVCLFGKDPDMCKPEVVCNLLMSLLASIYAPEHIPFSFAEAMKDTVFYQVQMLFHYITTH